MENLNACRKQIGQEGINICPIKWGWRMLHLLISVIAYLLKYNILFEFHFIIIMNYNILRKY